MIRSMIVVFSVILFVTFLFSIPKTYADLTNMDIVHISYGDNVTNSIILPGYIDVYTFDGEAGDIINIQMKGEQSNFDPRIELYCPLGTLITEEVKFNGLLKIDTLRLSDPGIYSIFVMDEGKDDTSSYGLSLQRVFNPPNAEVLEYDKMISAEIGNLAETDAYTLNGTVGDIFVLQMKGIEANFDPRLEIYDPQGSLMASGKIANKLLRIDTLKITESGLYTILVMDWGGNDTGFYNIFLQRTFNVPNAAILEYNSTISAEISNFAEMDAYVLDGTTGDIIVLHMKGSETGFDPRIEIYNPDGSLFASGEISNKLLRIDTLRLAESGWYTILAMDWGGNNISSYNISIQRTNDPINATQLEYNSTVLGEITNLAEMDAYSFNGTAGDIIILQMRAYESSFDPRIEIYNPEGHIIAEREIANTLLRIDTLKISESGKHTILVMDWGANNFSSYSVSIQRTSDPPDAVVLNYNNTVLGEISNFAEMDAFSFNGTTGDIIILQMRGIETGFDSRLEIYNPEGLIIAAHEKNNYLLRIDSLKISESGRYTILAMDKGGNNIGSYSVSLQRTFDPPDAILLNYNSTVLGEVSNFAEMDAFSLNGTAGDIIVMQIRGSEGSFDPRIEIYNPEGVLIASDEISDWMLRIDSLLLPESGSYTFLVMDVGGNLTSSYSISLQRTFQPPNAPLLDYGNPISASIDNLAEMDAITFNATQGDTMNIVMAASESTFDPRVEIYNPEGLLVTSGIQIDGTLYINDMIISQPGEYTILAMDEGGGQVSGYEISFGYPTNISIKKQVLPEKFFLSRNFPNPFNPSTTIKYGLPRPTKVSLKIYNVNGQKIRTLVDQEQESGFYSVTWDGCNDFGIKMATGSYFYQILTSEFVATEQMLLLK